MELSAILFCLILADNVFSATPSIPSPVNNSIIGPGTNFNFSYRTIADYGTSSYNFTVWLFTSPPTLFTPRQNFATGYYYGRFSEPNYPGNPNPPNPPPKELTMPNFAIPDGGYGAGAQAHDATFFLTVIEEYGTGDGSVGYRISLVYNQIRYNVTKNV